MIIPMQLPRFCFNPDRTFRPTAAVVHYLHVDPDSSAFATRPADWQRFDVHSLFNLLVELNRPRRERGPLLKRLEPGEPWADARDYASYHGLISQSGDIYQLVPDDALAYHAGYSWWDGREECNSWAWGIALAGPEYTRRQYEALAEWARSHGLGIQDLNGHDTVRRLWKEHRQDHPKWDATPYKPDPGPTFDWGLLREVLE